MEQGYKQSEKKTSLSEIELSDANGAGALAFLYVEDSHEEGLLLPDSRTSPREDTLKGASNFIKLASLISKQDSFNIPNKLNNTIEYKNMPSPRLSEVVPTVNTIGRVQESPLPTLHLNPDETEKQA